MELIYAGLASFLFVFLKAFQQRNVAFDHYIPILPISFAMSATEIYIVSAVVVLGYSWGLVLCVGAGAGVGALVAMVLHKRVFTHVDGRP